MGLNKSELNKVGTNTLKTILQLVRYDIPVLIVGKSSIGKSYTIIELTEKWRVPSSMLYIGSEKPENIEGLAKLISKDYDTERDSEGKKIRTGEDILKFLKPYWFPNTSTITTQVANGQRIFDNYITYYDKPGTKFRYDYKILHQILICLMDVDYEKGKNDVDAILEDRGNNNLSDVAGAPEILNSRPFKFVRSPETDVQAETAYEYTLDALEAGRDDIRDMCMYLCTVLGYGNYWLILDELDKVSDHEQEKYAPLLHIVRERTLKSWTMKEINDKKGMPIPLGVDYGDYRNMVDLVRSQIQNGLPLMDCRVIGIANATKDIEDALFRRFCQIIMRSTMSLYPPNDDANKVMECVDEFLPNRMDVTMLLKKVKFLDEVNLQWQYSFLPKMLNDTDTSGNFFYQNFNEYVDFKTKGRIDRSNIKNVISILQNDAKVWSETAWGVIWKDNFLGGKSNFTSDEGLKDLYSGLTGLWHCLAKEYYAKEMGAAGPAMAGAKKVGGGTKTPLMRLRDEIASTSQTYGDSYIQWLESDLSEKYTKTKGNPSALKNWTQNALMYIQAANENEAGEYDQLGKVGEKMIPVIYKVIVQNLRYDREIDTDLFNDQMKTVTEFFTKFLNQGGDAGTHTLKVDVDETEKLMYGGTARELRGMKPATKASMGKASLYGSGEFMDSLSMGIYIRYYLQSSFLIFFDTILGDNEKYIEFIQESKKGGTSERILNFMKEPKIKSIIENIYASMNDRMKKSGNGVRLKELLDKHL